MADKQTESLAGPGFRLLSLDGGRPGNFELSQLIFLRKLMELIESDKRLSETPLPCKYFDLIGGSGLGGLFALLLGPLRFSVNDVIEAYCILYTKVFSTKAWSERNIDAATNLLYEAIQEFCSITKLDLDQDLENCDREGCKAFVCTQNPINVNFPILLQSYRPRTNRAPTCSMRDALFTSIADQDHLKPLILGTPPSKQTLVAARQRFNNPIYEVVQEAQKIFGASQNIACLVSLGAGRPEPLSVPLSGPVDYDSVVRIADDCERHSEIIGRMCADIEHFYIRLNVTQEKQSSNVSNDSADNMKIVTTYAEQYCRLGETEKSFEWIEFRLLERPPLVPSGRLNSICGLDADARHYAAVKKLESGIKEMRSEQAMEFASNKYLNDLKPAILEDNIELRPCMEGTRVDILNKVDDWIEDLAAPNILWIAGYPGTGKSAVATSVTERLREKSCLGAAFFFERGNSKQKSTAALWRQVAFDLSRRLPKYAEVVIEKLKAGQVDASRTTANQLFYHLIEQPLRSEELQETFTSPGTDVAVIVIDALDECGGMEGTKSEERKDLLRHLCRCADLPIKVVVTSREEDDIVRNLCEKSRRLALLAGVGAEDSPDICLYLERKFRSISDSFQSLSENWPGPDTIRELTRRASGLFIWASTVIRIVEDGDPVEQLESLTDVGGSLPELYRQILVSAFGENPTEKFVARFKSVCGTLILAKGPLSSQDIAELCGISTVTLEHIRNRLRSVLDGSEYALRFSHQTFVDYLSDPLCPESFSFQKSARKCEISHATLRMLRQKLRFNICGFPSSSLENSQVKDLPSRLKDAQITRAVAYCCNFWGLHISDSPHCSKLEIIVEEFLDKFFLFWLELASLLGDVRMVSNSLLALMVWTKDNDSRLNSKLYDARRFLRAFGTLIGRSAPQIYLSALPFSPYKSWVMLNFSEKFPNILKVESGGDSDWIAEETCIEDPDCDGPITSLAFSHDNTRIVSGQLTSLTKKICIWDAETGELVSGPFFHGRYTEPRIIPLNEISSESEIGDAESEISDTASVMGDTESTSGDKESEIIGSEDFSLFFLNDSKRIVCGTTDGIFVRDTETGDVILGPFGTLISSITVTHDSRRIISGSLDKTISIWDAENGGLVLGPFGGHTDRVTAVAVSNDGQRVASGSSDETVRIWESDAATGDLVTKQCLEHTHCVTSVAFSQDSRRVVSSSHETVCIWNVETGQLISGPFLGHTNWVTSVSFSNDGNRVVSGSEDHTICIWDADTGRLLSGPLEDTAQVSSVAYSHDSKRVVSGSWDGTIRIWDVLKEDVVSGPFPGHTDGVTLVGFSQDRRSVVFGLHDMTIRIWDTESGDLVSKEFEGHTNSFESLAFSNDCKKVASASGSDDNTMNIWDVGTGKLVSARFEAQTEHICSIAFSHNSKRVVSGSWDGTIRIWDANTGKLVLGPLGGCTEHVSSIAFSHDSEKIVSGSSKTICIWNVKTGDLILGPLVGHTGSVTSVAFSHDSEKVVSGSMDNTICIWNVRTGKPVSRPFEGHTSLVQSVAFSHDGKRVVSGSNDNTVCIWDAETGDLALEPYEGHMLKVSSVAFSHDSKKIVSGSADGTIRIWDADIDSIKNVERSIHSGVPKVSDNQVIIGFSPNVEHWLLLADSPVSENSLSRKVSQTAKELPTVQDSQGNEEGQTSENFMVYGFDGWVEDPSRKRLFWIPERFRAGLWTRGTQQILSKKVVRLDLSKFVYGRNWYKCFNSTLE